MILGMARPAKPIEIIKAEGKTHLTKEEIEFREKNEIKIGENLSKKTIKAPKFLSGDKVAVSKWKEVLNNYRGTDFVSTADLGLLARYCKTFSEYQNLVEYRDKISEIDFSGDDEKVADETLSKSEVHEKKVSYILGIMEMMISVQGIMSIDNAINKKMTVLLQMEDRLFLNPLAKIKNIPRQVKGDGENEDEKEMFG